MSGHSKWHSIKHKKGAADAKRGKLFAVLIRQIEIAARSGGGDPASNATLRQHGPKGARQLVAGRHHPARHQARDRARKRGHLRAGLVRGLRGRAWPVIVQALSDNRNRTSAEIKNIFSRNGGRSPSPGAVSWQFERKASCSSTRRPDEDELTLAAADAGAEDVQDLGRLVAGDHAPNRACTRCAPRSRTPGSR
jgi:transcriptional/translational regulatory protein YebC/TACO1